MARDAQHELPEGTELPQRVRVVTAASLFDGHDASINIVRRILQSKGAEVIHLGHDRSVDEIVTAAIQEHAHAVAVSSYQGGHNEFFRYMVDQLRLRGAPQVRVYGGGGGTILPQEIEELQAHGVARIFTPEDGRLMGLEGMIDAILAECSRPAQEDISDDIQRLSPEDPAAVARVITWLQDQGPSGGAKVRAATKALQARIGAGGPVVVGFTGTGGAGKSSVIDEMVRRFRAEFTHLSLGLLLVDPTRRRSGGALLGDRIRMNAIHGSRIYVRSMATRRAHQAVPATVQDALSVLRAAGYDLVLLETAGIGQADSEVVDLVDVSVYVMTPDYGAPSQLEKIDMLDLARIVVVNKCDRRGAEDALRDVRKQWKRNRGQFQLPDDEVPVFATVASRWGDPGTEDLYQALKKSITEAGAGALAQPARPAGAPQAARKRKGSTKSSDPLPPPPRQTARPKSMIPQKSTRYLADIAETIRNYREDTEQQAQKAALACGIARALADLGDAVPACAQPYPMEAEHGTDATETVLTLRSRYNAALEQLDSELWVALQRWPSVRAAYEDEYQEYTVRGRSIRVTNRVQTLSHSELPRVATPRTQEWGELTRYLRQENLPGHFPYTAGVFPFRRQAEDPGRMFAGEGGPERTNRRFHFLSRKQRSVRLSTAFDSVTLYGRDPHERPDVYGKIGNAGVSICTVDDTKKLYSGFDLCDPKTSVSMTINGPAPMVLAFFLNAAIDQQVEKHLRQRGDLEAVRERLKRAGLPRYDGELPDDHDGLGLGLLGIPGDMAVDPETYRRIKQEVLRTVRGTVQADILKEDQAQNTCIFSTDFALKMMGDVQAYFIQNQIENFYSVSVSGYHIAEAGANPITQLAFTLANGFTYVEYYLARGLSVDDFAPNFSFFFSNGLEAEYSVIGRVARRIWAIAMRERYGASERSQILKYHIQTSGRSLHAQEMAFNDIRTTLQALTALQDRCNSLHTNAYDEAVTTPTEESVRRALAIQLIIGRELGLMANENSLQGSYIVDAMTDLVEEAVLREFELLSDRGGVLGAMETLYQRNKIQEESLYYESLKHSGQLPIVGVNTFEDPDSGQISARPKQVTRSTEREKKAQLRTLKRFQKRWRAECDNALGELRSAARSGQNVFEALMETAKVASLGQMTQALFEVGGEYRRAM